MNQEEFFLANQVDGVLTNEQMAQMLNLPEGDSGLPPQSSEPAAALVKEPAAVVIEVEPKPEGEPAPLAPDAETQPVIQAKDGVHTIPYEKLTEARDAEKAARAHAAQLQQELEALKSAPATPAATATEPPVATPVATPATEAELFGDYSEEAIAKGVEKLVDAKTAVIKADLEARFATALEPLQKQQAMSAAEQHFSTIAAKHPDAEAIAESAEMSKWIEAQPTFVRPALQAVLTKGTAAEVIELLDNFKTATGKTAAVPAPSAKDIAAAAQAAIDKAQAKPPTSLSEIPAGSTAHHDEAEAMLEMSSAGLMSKFEGKTPEQIAALMNKVL